jgi:hypothetical protein
MRKNAPGDTGQLIGQRNRQHIAVQPLFGGFNPGLEPVALPALRLDQHHPRRLYEQDPQIAILGPSRHDAVRQDTSHNAIGPQISLRPIDGKLSYLQPTDTFPLISEALQDDLSIPNEN